MSSKPTEADGILTQTEQAGKPAEQSRAAIPLGRAVTGKTKWQPEQIALLVVGILLAVAIVVAARIIAHNW